MSEARIKRADTTPHDPGGWYFVVVAANGEVVATSEIYTRPEDAERGVEDLAEIMADPTFSVEAEAE